MFKNSSLMIPLLAFPTPFRLARGAGVAIALSTLILGCSASRIEPTLYPDAFLRSRDQAQVARDISECNELADQYVKDADRYDRLARNTVEGAAVGSAAGALGGVIMGNAVGRSVGAGAAVGAIIPVLRSIFETEEPTPTRRRFVEHCLANIGYKVF